MTEKKKAVPKKKPAAKTSVQGTSTKAGAKSAKKAPRPEPPPIETTDAWSKFEAALAACSVMERLFIKHRLEGANNTVAAKRAGYSAHTAEEQGARLLGRVRVFEAIQAGWTAQGFGPKDVVGGIREMVDFDPSEVMSYVHEVVTDVIERPAAEALAEAREEITVTRHFLNELKQEEAPADEWKPVEARIRALRKRELELVVALGRDPEATVLERVDRRKRVPYIDLEKVQAAGKTKFITGVKNTPHGRNIELISRKDVLDMAGRAHGVFKDRTVLENPDGSPVNNGPATVIVLPHNGRDST